MHGPFEFRCPGPYDLLSRLAPTAAPGADPSPRGGSRRKESQVPLTENRLVPDPHELPISELIQQKDANRLARVLDELGPRAAAREVCELSDEEQAQMLSMMEPAAAAEVLDDLPDVEVTDVVGLLDPGAAAAILAELPSDDQADVLGSLESEDAAAILSEMDPTTAQQLTELVAYDPDTAGGLMATEVVSFEQDATVAQVLEALRRDPDKLRRLDVQYTFVTDRQRRLVGVLRLRDLLLADAGLPIRRVMIQDPLTVPDSAPLAVLDAFFEQHSFLGVPVIGPTGRLLGVVSRSAVDEATEDRATSDFRRSLGVVEEEIRSMPTWRRSRLRLSWLSINIVLNIVAASVIAGFQDTLSQVIALAIFLPIISDMSGCSGNQSVAVSMRELSLGLVDTHELARVLGKELLVGLANGLALGGLLGGVAWFFSGNHWLGFVVGIALAGNTLLAVLIGGSLPLLLKRRGVDPALAAGPILTTITDMFGFFLVLGIATLLLPWLVTN